MRQNDDALAVLREAILQLADAHARLVEAVTQDMERLERALASHAAALEELHALIGGGPHPIGTVGGTGGGITLATEMAQLHVTRLLRIPVGTDRFR